jgi:CheY-like chemotaxis protein
VTLDIDMPGVDGFAVLDRLKKHPTRATSRCTSSAAWGGGTRGSRPARWPTSRSR